eukprot:6194512-Pleurochrysis_carterae.AAC.2
MATLSPSGRSRRRSGNDKPLPRRCLCKRVKLVCVQSSSGLTHAVEGVAATLRLRSCRPASARAQSNRFRVERAAHTLRECTLETACSRARSHGVREALVQLAG